MELSDDDVSQIDFNIRDSLRQKPKLATAQDKAEIKFCDDSLYAQGHLILYTDKEATPDRATIFKEFLNYSVYVMMNILQIKSVITNDNCDNIKEENKVDKKDVEKYLKQKFYEYESCSCEDAQNGMCKPYKTKYINNPKEDEPEEDKPKGKWMQQNPPMQLERSDAVVLGRREIRQTDESERRTFFTFSKRFCDCITTLMRKNEGRSNKIFISYYDIFIYSIRAAKTQRKNKDINLIRDEIFEILGKKHNKGGFFKNFLKIFDLFSNTTDCVDKTMFKDKLYYRHKINSGTIRLFIPGLDLKVPAQQRTIDKYESIATGIRYSAKEAQKITVPADFTKGHDNDHLLPYYFCLIFNIAHEDVILIPLESKINKHKKDAIPRIFMQDDKEMIDTKFVCRLLPPDLKGPTTTWPTKPFFEDNILKELDEFLKYYDKNFITRNPNVKNICMEAMRKVDNYDRKIKGKEVIEDEDEDEDEDEECSENYTDKQNKLKKDWHKKHFDGISEEEWQRYDVIVDRNKGKKRKESNYNKQLDEILNKGSFKVNKSGYGVYSKLFNEDNDDNFLTFSERMKRYSKQITKIIQKIHENNGNLPTRNILDNVEKRSELLYNFFEYKYFRYLDEIELMVKESEYRILKIFGLYKKKKGSTHQRIEKVDGETFYKDAASIALDDSEEIQFIQMLKKIHSHPDYCPKNIILSYDKAQDLFDSDFVDMFEPIKLILLYELNKYISNNGVQIEAISDEINALSEKESPNSKQKLDTMLTIWKKWTEEEDCIISDKEEDFKTYLDEIRNSSTKRDSSTKWHMPLGGPAPMDEEEREAILAEEEVLSDSPPSQAQQKQRAPTPMAEEGGIVEVVLGQPKSKRPRTTTGGKKHTKKRVKKSSKKKLGYKLRNTRKQK